MLKQSDDNSGIELKRSVILGGNHLHQIDVAY